MSAWYVGWKLCHKIDIHERQWLIVQNTSDWLMVENTSDWLMVENTSDWLFLMHSDHLCIFITCFA